MINQLKRPTALQISGALHIFGALKIFGAAGFVMMAASTTHTALAEEPLAVASSIAPVEMVVRQIGGDAITSSLILPASQSAHHTALRPSQSRMITKSDLIFAIDPLMESALAKIMTEAPEKWALFSTLMADDLSRREEDHDDHEGHDDHDGHDDHEGHDDHDGHDGHEDHDGHDGHESHESHDGHDGHDDHDDHEGHEAHEEEAHHGHPEGGYDYHLFFSPTTMTKMAAQVAERLSAARPEKASYFAANYQTMRQKLAVAKQEMAEVLHATAPNHFIAMHDISFYLEADLPISPSGFLLTNSHGKPSARHLRELQKTARADAASCVLYEPQLSKRLVSQLAADMDLPLVMMDPLGASEGDVSAYWGAIGDALESCFNR